MCVCVEGGEIVSVFSAFLKIILICCIIGRTALEFSALQSRK